ncbi:disease resistance protein Pik-1-like isoform X2 [Neltuma alba]|uniref:disease resistance protein Pik-1-like isoform X2 n=1 Tax=Neltuma alba TaxID=207710 RepID=UPI0010A319D4|nr:disease resistance protein Pik-1-like isoform X2 [Prosopis alba]
MKQKIVVQVPMHCDNCRTKALKIASVVKGRVHSVALEGGDRDRVVVVGEDVDSVCLAKDLRKKFTHATIVSVEEVKDKKKEETKPEEWLRYWHPPPYNPYVVCEEYRDDGCTVM